MTHTYDIIPDDRNISAAERAWDSPVDISRGSNTYKLFNALTTALDSVDAQLEDVYAAQHIDSAHGSDLDKFGKLVNVQRKQKAGGYGTIAYGEDYGAEPELESDDRYRARIKANFAASTTGTTWNDFVEFTTTVLDVAAENIDFITPYEANPATITVRGDEAIFTSNDFTTDEVVELLASGVPAGHNVNAVVTGTFELKADGDTDDPSKGLTGDNTTEGGTISSDVTE